MSFAGLWFRDLGGLSLRLFVYERAMAAFLFHVAESKFYHFILGRIHVTFFSSWKSHVSLLPNNSGIPRGGDESVTRRYVARVHAKRSPE